MADAAEKSENRMMSVILQTLSALSGFCIAMTYSRWCGGIFLFIYLW